MKRFFCICSLWLQVIAVLAQHPINISNTAHRLSNAQAKALQIAKPRSAGPRASTQSLELNYALIEDTFGRRNLDSISYYSFPVNKHFAANISNNQKTRWIYQGFDSLMSYTDLHSYCYRCYNVTLDSIGIPFRHQNVTGTQDTIIIVVYDKSPTAPHVNFENQILDSILFADTIITNSSLVNDTLYHIMQYNVGLSILQGHHFGVAVYFSGDVLNSFEVIGNSRSTCRPYCGATPSSFERNYFADLIFFDQGYNYSGMMNNKSGFFHDCNANQQYDENLCEDYILQQFDLSAYVTLSPTINSKPIAGFTVSADVIEVGNSVSFTDVSPCAGTSWQWSFPGGTPSSSTLQNPTVTYNEEGNFNSSLIATNSYGSDTVLGNWVVVNAPSTVYTSCDSFNNYATSEISFSGFVAGNNSRGDVGMAEYFSNRHPGYAVTKATVRFGLYTASSHTGQQFLIKLWAADGPNNAPGTVLDSQYVLYDSVMPFIGIKHLSFANNPVPAGDFYIGITFGYHTGDNISLLTSTDVATQTNTLWQQNASGNWYPCSDAVHGIGQHLTSFITAMQCPAICSGFDAMAAPAAASCTINDGAVTTTVSGGAPPYDYTWSNTSTTPSLTGLATGQYIVTITDANNCRLVRLATVKSGTITSDIQYASQPVCKTANGKLTAIPDAGTSPYSYEWSNGSSLQTITSLPKGLYTLTISDANGCTSTSVFALRSENRQLTGGGITGLSSESCGLANGYAVASASFGAHYDFEWATGATTDSIYGLSAGFYNVTMTDSLGCTNVKTVAIGSVGLSVVGSNTLATCGLSDGTASVIANGLPPYQYAWNTLPPQITDTATGLAAGMYEVTVTDRRNCSSVHQIKVSTPCDSVWPGDINLDGVAGAMDALLLSMTYGQIGPIRPNASLVWHPQQSPGWAGYTLGINDHHSDTNADGVVDVNDTLAISLNYGTRHQKASSAPQPNDPVISFVPVTDTIYTDQDFRIKIMLGTLTNTADSVYGLAFRMNLDANIFDTTVADLNLSRSWLGTIGVNAFSFRKMLNTEIEMVLARTDHKNVNGYGQIGELVLRAQPHLPNGAAYTTVHLTPEIITGITAAGRPKTYNTQTRTLIAKDPTVGISETPFSQSIQLYPNPNNGHFVLAINQPGHLLNIELLNVQGQQLYAEQVKDAPTAFKKEFDLGDLAKGIYLLKLGNENGAAVKRLVVQ